MKLSTCHCFFVPSSKHNNSIKRIRKKRDENLIPSNVDVNAIISSSSSLPYYMPKNEILI
jgi:hypothetical protein